VLPGRTEPRLYQFGRNVPLEVVGRANAEWVQAPDEKDSSDEPAEIKKEDWFLVRGVATRPPGETLARGAEPTLRRQRGDQTVTKPHLSRMICADRCPSASARAPRANRSFASV